jgi:hypothetical protein
MSQLPIANNASTTEKETQGADSFVSYYIAPNLQLGRCDPPFRLAVGMRQEHETHCHPAIPFVHDHACKLLTGLQTPDGSFSSRRTTRS